MKTYPKFLMFLTVVEQASQVFPQKTDLITMQSMIVVSLQLWDMITGELLQTFVFPSSIMSVTMDTSEYRLFAGGSNGTIFGVNMYGQVGSIDIY